MPSNERKVQTEGLGKCLEEFKPMMGNIIAGFIISGLMVVGGIAAIGFPLNAAAAANWDLPFSQKQGWCWVAVGLLGFLGLVLVVGGVGVAMFSKGLISHRVEICVNGFRSWSGKSSEEVAWTEIARIRQTTLYERPPIVKGPVKLLVPKIASTIYSIVTISGKEYAYNGNSIKELERFGELLRQHADRLSLKWEPVEEHA